MLRKRWTQMTTLLFGLGAFLSGVSAHANDYYPLAEGGAWFYLNQEGSSQQALHVSRVIWRYETSEGWHLNYLQHSFKPGEILFSNANTTFLLEDLPQGLQARWSRAVVENWRAPLYPRGEMSGKNAAPSSSMAQVRGKMLSPVTSTLSEHRGTNRRPNRFEATLLDGLGPVRWSHGGKELFLLYGRSSAQGEFLSTGPWVESKAELGDGLRLRLIVSKERVLLREKIPWIIEIRNESSSTLEIDPASWKLDLSWSPTPDAAPMLQWSGHFEGENLRPGQNTYLHGVYDATHSPQVCRSESAEGSLRAKLSGASRQLEVKIPLDIVNKKQSFPCGSRRCRKSSEFCARVVPGAGAPVTEQSIEECLPLPLSCKLTLRCEECFALEPADIDAGSRCTGSYANGYYLIESF